MSKSMEDVPNKSHNAAIERRCSVLDFLVLVISAMPSPREAAFKLVGSCFVSEFGKNSYDLHAQQALSSPLGCGHWWESRRHSLSAGSR